MAGTRRKRHKISDYKFSVQKHSIPGIFSTVLGILSLIVLPILLNISFSAQGQAGMLIGALGLYSFIMAIAGLITGIVGIRQEDCYKLFPKIGITLSGLSTLIWALIYSMGANF